MLFRPRALNITDWLVKVQDEFVNGALLDFAILTFHTFREILNQAPNFAKRLVKKVHKQRTLSQDAVSQHGRVGSPNCQTPTSTSAYSATGGDHD